MEQPASREPEALESNQDSRLPDDLLQLLYVKQLSPSDAASSKQIKLPKNEVKGFLGDLRHKQRCMVVGTQSCSQQRTTAAQKPQSVIFER